jgi:hypothetical protein
MGGRGVIRLKYVHAFRDRMGRMRYYFRRHGKQTVLPGLPGSSEFMSAYAAQLNTAENKVALRPKSGARNIRRTGHSLLWLAPVPISVSNESRQLSSDH